MTRADNINRAEILITEIGSSPILNHIGGASVPAASGKTFETVSPIDMRHIADVARGDAADIDKAARAATDTFAAWRDLDGAKRKVILHRIADGIVARVIGLYLVDFVARFELLHMLNV